MTKTTLLVMILSTTLVLGTFSVGSAFAVEQGDTISFKGKANKVVVDPASEYSSKAKARAGLQLTVDNVDDFAYGGLGRIALELKFNLGAEFVLNPTDNVFGYTYDDAGNILTIQETQVQSESGEFFILSGTGSYDLDKKDKSRADITLNIGNLTGEPFFEIPVQGGMILNPITS